MKYMRALHGRSHRELVQLPVCPSAHGSPCVSAGCPQKLQQRGEISCSISHSSLFFLVSLFLSHWTNFRSCSPQRTTRSTTESTRKRCLSSKNPFQSRSLVRLVVAVTSAPGREQLRAAGWRCCRLLVTPLRRTPERTTTMTTMTMHCDVTGQTRGRWAVR